MTNCIFSKTAIGTTLLVVMTMLVISCEEGKKTLTDTPTSGRILVVADETYQPIMDSEKMVFETHYPDAHIDIIYKPAAEVLKDIDNDSVRVLITAIPIDSAYFENFYKQREYFPKSTILAKDALAVIAHNSRKGLKITAPELARICSGQMTNFSQIKNAKQSGNIALVFDHMQSSTVQYMQDSLLKGNGMSNKVYAQKTNTEVLQYVEKNPNALGIIGVSWISDHADEETMSFSKSIFPVEIGANEESVHFYSPHPGYIATHMYPLRRYMHATIKENGAALGRGFVNFMAGEIGQRIILKSGVVPAKVITRVVETRPQL